MKNFAKIAAMAALALGAATVSAQAACDRGEQQKAGDRCGMNFHSDIPDRPHIFLAIAALFHNSIT